MLRIIPVGKNRAKLLRNKRGGVRLKVCIRPDRAGLFCNKCWLNDKFGDYYDCGVNEVCREFERVTGTRKFWFERDEGRTKRRGSVDNPK
jgi:hypothetical protein